MSVYSICCLSKYFLSICLCVRSCCLFTFLECPIFFYLCICLSRVHLLVYKPFCLSICLSVHMSVSPPVCLSFHLSVSKPACLSIFLSLHLSLHLSLQLSVSPPVCLSICLSLHLSFYPSVCLSNCLSFHLSVCLPVCLSVCASHQTTVHTIAANLQFLCWMVWPLRYTHIYNYTVHIRDSVPFHTPSSAVE